MLTEFEIKTVSEKPKIEDRTGTVNTDMVAVFQTRSNFSPDPISDPIQLQTRSSFKPDPRVDRRLKPGREART
jgi:hypothetical protein